MSDSSGRPRPGTHQLVIRAAFVPDGAEPPPEFAGRWDQLRMRATYNPATGQLTCATPGTHFGGDIRAEWYPDQVPASQAGADQTGQNGDPRQAGTPDGAMPDSRRDRASGPAIMRNAPQSSAPDEASPYRQPDRQWAPTYRPPGGTWPARSGGQVPFGLAGNGSGGASRGGPASSPLILDPRPNGQNAFDTTADPSHEVASAAFDPRSRAEAQNGSVQPTEAEQRTVRQGGPSFNNDAQTPGAQSVEFARAARKTVTDAGAAEGAAPEANQQARPAKRPAASVAATPAPGEPRGPHLYKRFFDTLHQPLRDLAKDLGVPEDYLLGHAAHESSYLDNHTFPLNNPLGYTQAGGRDLAFPSIADAIAAYKKDYGPQIRGATSAKDFAERIQGKLNGKPVPGWRRYNTATQDYESKLLDLIKSIPGHKAEWLKHQETAQ